MTEREIELMLKNATEKMPIPKKTLEEIVEVYQVTDGDCTENEADVSLISKFESTEGFILEGVLTNKMKKRYLKWMENMRQGALKPIVTVFVILLSIGIVTIGMAYASGQYGGWVSIFRTQIGVELTHDINLRRSYGEYFFHNASIINIVPSDLINYEQSLFYSKYKVDDVCYMDAKRENSMYISIGSTQKEYWKQYFGYDETGTYRDYESDYDEEEDYPWTLVESEVFEYEGLKLFYSQRIIHSEAFSNGQLELTEISWVDFEQGICVDMTISYELAEKEEILGYAKQFINDYQN